MATLGAEEERRGFCHARLEGAFLSCHNRNFRDLNKHSGSPYGFAGLCSASIVRVSPVAIIVRVASMDA